MVSLTIAAKFPRNGNVRAVASTAADLSGARIYSSVVATSGRLAKATLTGLADDTQYYAAWEMDGILRTASPFSFKTLPSGNSFNFVFSGDRHTYSDSVVFDRIRELAPDFFVLLGDIHYENPAVNTEASVQAHFDKVFTSPKFSRLIREVPTLYVWDNHDYADVADSTATAHDAACTAFRNRFPHPFVSATATAPVYYVKKIGRTVLIFTDNVSAASPAANTDNSSKTLLGSTQKAWLKSVLSDVANVNCLFLWFTAVPWTGAAVVGSRRWMGYTTERTELADYIKANCAGRVMTLTADLHMCAYDDGTNGDYATGTGAPIPTCMAGPLDQTNSSGGGPYSGGFYNSDNGQFVQVDVADAGGSTITVTCTGQRVNGGGLTQLFQAAKVFTVA
jgi:phosphodiesterase/alkaline phosphatase D-like protein